VAKKRIDRAGPGPATLWMMSRGFTLEVRRQVNYPWESPCEEAYELLLRPPNDADEDDPDGVIAAQPRMFSTLQDAHDVLERNVVSHFHDQAERYEERSKEDLRQAAHYRELAARFGANPR